MKRLKNTIWHKLNLFNYYEVELLIKEIQPTHIIHLAWYTEHGKFWNSEKNEDWMNASIKLFQIFKKYDGKRFISAGTKECGRYRSFHFFLFQKPYAFRNIGPFSKCCVEISTKLFRIT